MEKMMPESGPFEAIISTCFSYMDCTFQSFVSATHTNGTVGISFAVSVQDTLQQQACRALMGLIGRQATILINRHPICVLVRGINYSLQNNCFSAVELRVQNTPDFMQHLQQP